MAITRISLWNTRAAIALLAALLFTGAALAQAPFVYPITVGTTPIQALPNNPLRKKIWLYNPNPVAKIAFCPVSSRGATFTCAIGGGGSVTIPPYNAIIIEANTAIAPLSMPGAWNVVADTPSSGATALEWE